MLHLLLFLRLHLLFHLPLSQHASKSALSLLMSIILPDIRYIIAKLPVIYNKITLILLTYYINWHYWLYSIVNLIKNVDKYEKSIFETPFCWPWPLAEFGNKVSKNTGPGCGKSLNTAVSRFYASTSRISIPPHAEIYMDVPKTWRNIPPHAEIYIHTPCPLYGWDPF